MAPPPYPASKIPQQPEQAAGGNPDGGNSLVWGAPDEEDASSSLSDASDHGSEASDYHDVEPMETEPGPSASVQPEFLALAEALQGLGFERLQVFVSIHSFIYRIPFKLALTLPK